MDMIRLESKRRWPKQQHHQPECDQTIEHVDRQARNLEPVIEHEGFVVQEGVQERDEGQKNHWKSLLLGARLASGKRTARSGWTVTCVSNNDSPGLSVSVSAASSRKSNPGDSDHPNTLSFGAKFGKSCGIHQLMLAMLA